MIVNVPSAEELREVSLRLYFKAWAEITKILNEWAEYGFLIETVEADEAWENYIAAAQGDLQGIYTLIQQSQEIGLKASICDVSPYLLLKRADVKPSGDNVWDFTDFPTVDAAELPRVHNVFCTTTLSPAFQREYDELRRSRNKISHLGIFRRSIDPLGVIDLMQTHYSELYPQRRWFADRLSFATLHRWSVIQNDDFNERTLLLQELWHLLPRLTDAQFLWLMHHPRNTPAYICFPCTEDAHLGGHDPYPQDVPTCFISDNNAVRCVVCDNLTETKLGKCVQPECNGILLSARHEDHNACMTCGWTKVEYEEHEARLADEMKNRLPKV